MTELEFITNPEVDEVFDKSPDTVRGKLLCLRALIIETAQETEVITHLEETLKWGQPSYITRRGSTLRLGWNEKATDQYAMYFQCTSRLVSTFKVVFEKQFRFEGNRAIVFGLTDEVPVNELKQCIKAALTYHNVKGLLTLGI